jgi:hypothetical protein
VTVAEVSTIGSLWGVGRFQWKSKIIGLERAVTWKFVWWAWFAGDVY